MTLLRGLATVFSFVALGSLAGYGVSVRHPDAARSAYVTLQRQLDLPPLTETPLAFRETGGCQVPVIDVPTQFHGGSTAGDRITLTLDGKAQTYRLRVEANPAARRGTLVHTGSVSLDRGDCSFVLSGAAPARFVINHDGVLFGRARIGSTAVKLVGFRTITNRLADLAGAWRIVGAGISRTALRQPNAEQHIDEARIGVDGTFSHCSLTSSSPLQCVPNSGRITATDDAFTAIDADGRVGSLIVGKVGSRLVPILLRPATRGDGLRFLVPQTQEGVAVAVSGRR
ncbi:MAG: hypothetical protein ACTHL1_08020, partial [Burkholderiaceae bacterium]